MWVSSSRLIGLHLLAAPTLRTAALSTLPRLTACTTFSAPRVLHLATVRRSQRPLMSAGGSLETQIKQTIAESKVVVYSKSYCPFCTKTKNLFSEMDVPITVIELDLMEGGSELQQALTALSGQRTVPNVFVNGLHVGGNDDTQAVARSGKLKEMLQ
eukprot:CAMPEP_0119379876 /NCGR_PEP_ID=MMETSP1334-20130426/54466_1 /TAXON_ID=127549 /ORGANISM="Calcidiscus leptoporus, Strain RCC1130" /LENGTH=156 /DNA_ID=CAMNT_0007399509 /DNA_START=18 /DNA_END=488 /DNA_ORIENTATION=-